MLHKCHQQVQAGSWQLHVSHWQLLLIMGVKRCCGIADAAAKARQAVHVACQLMEQGLHDDGVRERSLKALMGRQAEQLICGSSPEVWVQGGRAEDALQLLYILLTAAAYRTGSQDMQHPRHCARQP